MTLFIECNTRRSYFVVFYFGVKNSGSFIVHHGRYVITGMETQYTRLLASLTKIAFVNNVLEENKYQYKK